MRGGKRRCGIVGVGPSGEMSELRELLPSVSAVMAPLRSVRKMRAPSVERRSTTSGLGWPKVLDSPTEIATKLRVDGIEKRLGGGSFAAVMRNLQEVSGQFAGALELTAGLLGEEPALDRALDIAGEQEHPVAILEAHDE